MSSGHNYIPVAYKNRPLRITKYIFIEIEKGMDRIFLWKIIGLTIKSYKKYFTCERIILLFIIIIQNCKRNVENVDLN